VGSNPASLGSKRRLVALRSEGAEEPRPGRLVFKAKR